MSKKNLNYPRKTLVKFVFKKNFPRKTLEKRFYPKNFQSDFFLGSKHFCLNKFFVKKKTHQKEFGAKKIQSTKLLVRLLSQLVKFNKLGQVILDSQVKLVRLGKLGLLGLFS